MGNFLKRAIKGFVTLAIVGSLLAVAAPYMAAAAGLEASALGLSALSSQPLWTGLYFGGFGAINAALAPVVDKLLGKSFKDQPLHKDTVGAAPAAAIAHGHVVGHAIGHAADLAEGAETTHFRDKVGGPRHHDMSFQEQVDASRLTSAGHTIH